MTSLNTNGLAPTTWDIPRTFLTLSSHSKKSPPDFCTSRCALAPRILDLRSASKPLMTLSTTSMAHTPTVTPATLMNVMTLMKLCRRLASR